MQERILLDRDRVVANTWYNEEKKRWEIDPVAVPYAVSKRLVDHARIRHDWAAMYVTLKGDDKEFYLDIKAIHRYIMIFICYLFLFNSNPAIFFRNLK